MPEFPESPFSPKNTVSTLILYLISSKAHEIISIENINYTKKTTGSNVKNLPLQSIIC